MSTTPDLSEINPHLALWQSENYVSPAEKAWDRFVAKVEALLGHSLDGDQDRDGYSMDYAYSAFDEGLSPEAYVREISEEKFALLTTEYAAWNKAQGLNLGSADEHLSDEKLTAEQRAWLADFVRRCCLFGEERYS